MPEEDAIVIRNLTRSFDKLVAVDHVDLEIKKGEFFGLLGPNGAGKTTLIRTLVGLCTPTDGSATIFGKDVVKDKYAARELIGVVPQDFNFDENLTTRDILTYHAGYFGMERREREARADELLEFLEIKDKANTACTKLSGGMKRRLLIGRALMQRPKLLFLDEPTTGVDVQLRRSLWEMLKKLNDDGTTIILTTHYIEEAENLCTRVAIMDHGKIIAMGSPKELIQSSGSGNLIEIAFSGGTPPDLKIIPEVRRVWWKDGMLSVRVTDPNTAAVKILDMLRTSGMSVKSMHVTESSLEDVFIKLTGRELRE
ncbi:ABC transporter ATP-binding protein [Methanocella arvoryzae]|uniref:ABC-type transport system, ATPase component n=1 Tax=Methanocella arvoryzae (strain DSM 22066 / NBRC 105507 / MRE50) TaxID=351160 RepID=Q0W188_METAR|nr:ABC transporter ATP-binding protein [Methanocella arvoryzae]CAJ37855.1 ABC-type transport system, ATPase component [Methanocella arvoryzae MRE50]